jgi:hypothetical protein
MEQAGGVVQQYQAQPDRIFYILDVTSTHEYLWEVDGYCTKDGTTGKEMWLLNVVCPACRQNLNIESAKKHIEVEKDRISIEHFRCSYPAEFGGQCKFSAAVEPPPPSQRYTRDQHGRQVRVDGVYKRG